MSGHSFLLDTNAVLYLLNGNQCMREYLAELLSVSVITEMEVLSFHGINLEEEHLLRSFFKECTVFQLDKNVQYGAILLRRKYKMKLPDSIIAATAWANNLPLVTADLALRRVEEVDVRLLRPEIIN